MIKLSLNRPTNSSPFDRCWWISVEICSPEWPLSNRKLMNNGDRRKGSIVYWHKRFCRPWLALRTWFMKHPRSTPMQEFERNLKVLERIFVVHRSSNTWEWRIWWKFNLSSFIATSIYWRVCMCARARVFRFPLLISTCTVPPRSALFSLSVSLFYDYLACWRHCKYEVIFIEKTNTGLLCVSIIDRINQVPRYQKVRSSGNDTLQNSIMLFAKRVHS